MWARYSRYPGRFALKIYNSAGEAVRTLKDIRLGRSVEESYFWDGRKDAGEMCASGVYIVFLTAPRNVYYCKILLVH